MTPVALGENTLVPGFKCDRGVFCISLGGNNFGFRFFYFQKERGLSFRVGAGDCSNACWLVQEA
jgi:hypothetical protein